MQKATMLNPHQQADILIKSWPNKKGIYDTKDYRHGVTGKMVRRLTLHGSYDMLTERALRAGLAPYVLSRKSDYIIFIIPMTPKDDAEIREYINNGKGKL